MLNSIEWTVLYGLRQEIYYLDAKILSDNQNTKLIFVREYIQHRIDELESRIDDRS